MNAFAPLKPALDGCRILLAEDEAMIALNVADDLEDAGCKVVGPAMRLDEAIRLAAQAEIDVGILDVNLAGQAIWPVAAILSRRNIPFALLTGYPTIDPLPTDFVSVVKLGKPLSRDILVETIGMLLSSRDTISP